MLGLLPVLPRNIKHNNSIENKIHPKRTYDKTLSYSPAQWACINIHWLHWLGLVNLKNENHFISSTSSTPVLPVPSFQIEPQMESKAMRGTWSQSNFHGCGWDLLSIRKRADQKSYHLSSSAGNSVHRYVLKVDPDKPAQPKNRHRHEIGTMTKPSLTISPTQKKTG